MKVVAIIQARMGSTRLPGKVLMELCGKSVLGHVTDRVSACRLVDEVVVATTESREDDPIVCESRRHGAEVFRGSEEDVLGRYYFAARAAHAEIVVRATSDCPLFDPDVLTAMLERFLKGQCCAEAPEYISNTMRRTFPRGIDSEVFTFRVLEHAFYNAIEPWEREHVTPFIYHHPELFRLENFVAENDCSGHRWTLDTEDDWRFLDAVYAALGASGNPIRYADVLALLATRPEIVALNSHVEQKKLLV